MIFIIPKTGSWSSPVQILTDSHAHYNPSIAIDSSDNIHLTWYGCSDISTSVYQIRYSKYSGGSWSSPIDITGESSDQYKPSIGLDENDIPNIIWYREGSNLEIRYSKYIGGRWLGGVDLTSGSYSQKFPSMSIDASGIVWQGNTNVSGVSTAATGVMFGTLPSVAEHPTNVVASDIANNGDGRDIQVTFNGASDETNISGYRIYAVRARSIAAFTETMATGLAATKYIAEAKNGNNGAHTVTLTQALLDSDGNSIVNEGAYYIYVMGVGQNGYLSAANVSNRVTLVTTAADVGNSKIVTTNTTVAMSSNGARTIAKDSSGNYYSVYSALYDGYNHIFMRKSEDGGNSWKYWTGTGFDVTGRETPIETSGDYDQANPSIAIDSSNNLHVVWYGKSSASPFVNQIRYSKYSAGSWSSPTDLTNEINGQDSPSMALDSNNNIHIVWRGLNSSMQNRIRYIKYSGGSWSSFVDIDYGNVYRGDPSIAVDSSNNLHVVWRKSDIAYCQIAYSKYNGSSWSSSVFLTNESCSQYGPSIAVDSSNNLHVAFYGNNCIAANQIRYIKYDGTSWSSPMEVTGGYDQYNPSIAVDNNDVPQIIWYGKSSVSTTKYQIRYSKYISGRWLGGADLTSGSYDQIYPSIASGASGIVWNGNTNTSNASTSSTGAMFGALPSVVTPPTNVAATDIANNEDGRDIQVTFTGASDETNVSGYRIYILPVSQLYVMTETIASGLASTRYVAEVKNGNSGSHTVTLTQGLLDSTGASLGNEIPYYIYVMAVGQNGYLSYANISSRFVISTIPATGTDKIVTSNTTAGLAGCNGGRTVVKSSDGNWYSTFVARYEGYNHIFVRKSEDNGVTWKYWNGTAFDVTGRETPIEASGDYNQANPCIEVDSSNNVHVVWQGKSSTSTTYKQLRYIKYSEGSWSSVVNLTNGSWDECNPSMVIDNANNIHVVWHYGGVTQIYYIKYNGTSWGSETNISPGGGADHQYNPSIAVDSNNNLYVAWQSLGSNNEIKYSIYNGSSWSSPANISTSGGYSQYDANLAVDSSDSVYVVWQGLSNVSPSYSQIRYSKYSGGSWSSPVDLTSGNYNQYNPSIAVDSSNNLHVVWYGKSATSTTYNQIRYMKYSGGSWSGVTNVTSGNYNMQYPTIAKGAYGFIWQGLTDASYVSSNANGVMAYVFPDTTPPTINLSQNPTETTTGSVTITATITDDGGVALKKYASGSQNAEYFATSGTVLAGTTFDVSSNGTYTVYAKDNAGNETVQTITISNIDTDAPIITGVTEGGVYNTSRTITFDKGTATLNGGAFTSGSQAVAEGTHTLIVTYSENDTTIHFTIDKTAPIDPVISANPTTPTGGSVTITITYAGDASVKAYTIDGGESQPYTAPFTVASNCTVAAGSQDAAGNWSGEDSYVVSNITTPLVMQGITTMSDAVKDLGNDGDARDIRVMFKGATNEKNILEYRVIVVRSAVAGAFNVSTASGLTSTSYAADPVKGRLKIHLFHLPQTLQNSEGNPITGGVAYTVYVLAVGKNGYADVLTSIGTVTLDTNNEGYRVIASKPTVMDTGNKGNGTDIKVTFRKSKSEVNVQEYRVIVSTTTLTLVQAQSVLAAGYKLITPTNPKLSYIVTLGAAQKSQDGVSAIQNGTAYKIYILAIGKNGYANVLSAPSNAITLSQYVPGPLVVRSLKAAKVGTGHDSTNIKVTFYEPIAVSNIQEYRVFIAPSASTLNQTTAEGIADTNLYQVVATTAKGILHSVTLDSGKKDYTSAALTAGNYKVYVLTAGKTGYANKLSVASGNVTLN